MALLRHSLITEGHAHTQTFSHEAQPIANKLKQYGASADQSETIAVLAPSRK